MSDLNKKRDEIILEIASCAERGSWTHETLAQGARLGWDRCEAEMCAQVKKAKRDTEWMSNQYAEIEQQIFLLRNGEELKVARSAAIGWSGKCQQYEVLIAKLEAANERRRKALEEIAKLDHKAGQMAREALAGEVKS